MHTVYTTLHIRSAINGNQERWHGARRLITQCITPNGTSSNPSQMPYLGAVLPCKQLQKVVQWNETLRRTYFVHAFPATRRAPAHLLY